MALALVDDRASWEKSRRWDFSCVDGRILCYMELLWVLLAALLKETVEVFMLQ